MIEPGADPKTQNAPARNATMLKTLTAALVAASVLIAPLATGASAAQPAAKAAVTTTKVVKMNGDKRHFARHHKRHKTVKHVRGHKKDLVIRTHRHGKSAKAHMRAHIAVAPKTRAN